METDIYLSLLYKKLSGEISSSEKQKLDEWLAASGENRITAASVEKAWNASDSLKDNVQVDLDQAFTELEGLMEEEESPIQKEAVVKPIEKVLKKPRRAWLSVAAGFLLFTTVGFLIGNYLKKEVNPTLEWVSITTKDVGQMTSLNDGTKIYVNKHSELEYPKEFKGRKRLVKLKGEAFFEVEHDKTRPFIVETKEEEITVLGTSFNVNTKEEIMTTIYVNSGKVQVVQRDRSSKIILSKGEKGISNHKNKTVKNLGVKKSNDLAWHTKTLVFENTPLPEVLEQVGKFYNQHFKIDNENLKKCTFTSTFKNKKLNTVLSALETVLGVEILEQKNDYYLLLGGSCE